LTLLCLGNPRNVFSFTTTRLTLTLITIVFRIIKVDEHALA